MRRIVSSSFYATDGRRRSAPADWFKTGKAQTEQMFSAIRQALAGDVGADIIVAGAYGHSRATEWILGGVSRDVLMQSRRGCLVAH